MKSIEFSLMDTQVRSELYRKAHGFRFITRQSSLFVKFYFFKFIINALASGGVQFYWKNYFQLVCWVCNPNENRHPKYMHILRIFSPFSSDSIELIT